MKHISRKKDCNMDIGETPKWNKRKIIWEEEKYRTVSVEFFHVGFLLPLMTFFVHIHNNPKLVHIKNRKHIHFPLCYLILLTYSLCSVFTLPIRAPLLGEVSLIFPYFNNSFSYNAGERKLLYLFMLSQFAKFFRIVSSITVKSMNPTCYELYSI